eukprot:scaffold24916_cov24-Tisochrysis_lutea.AAC.1
MHNELHVVGWSLRSNSKSGHQVSVSAKMHVYLSSQAETAVEYIKEFLSKLQVRHMSFSKGTLGVKRDTPDLAVLREYGHVCHCSSTGFIPLSRCSTACSILILRQRGKSWRLTCTHGHLVLDCSDLG